jgi:hypothetical protein
MSSVQCTKTCSVRSTLEREGGREGGRERERDRGWEGGREAAYADICYAYADVC